MKKGIEIIGLVLTLGLFVYALINPENSDTSIAAAFATGFGTVYLKALDKAKRMLAIINEKDSELSVKEFEINKLENKVKSLDVEINSIKVEKEATKSKVKTTTKKSTK